MPKEVIPSGGTFDVRIGWTVDGYVQVGVESAEQRSLPWILYGDEETRASLGHQVLRVVEEWRERQQYEFATSTAEQSAHVELGADLLNLLDVLASGAKINTDDPPHYTYMGVWADLDRQGCNEAIRHLRRARDAAYGRDE